VNASNDQALDRLTARLARVRPATGSGAAYRADLASRPAHAPFSRDDGTWLLVTELAIQGILSDVADPAPDRFAAVTIARRHLGDSAVADGCRHDPPNRQPSPADPLRVLAEQMEYFGSLRLAATLLDAGQALGDWTTIDIGRILAQRARLARKFGDSGGALDRLAQLERLAILAHDDELRVRARLGRAALHQIAGNYPATERQAASCAALARRCGFSRLEAAARVGLISCAAHRGDYASALRYAAQTLQELRGETVAESEHAANLGRLLLDIGEPAAAYTVFARTVVDARLPHVLYPALGGLAVAAAATSAVEVVWWASRQVEAAAHGRGSLYESAAALIDCASALAGIGADKRAIELRDRAAELATLNGFHEIRYAAGDLNLEPVVAERNVRRSPAARRVIDQIAHWSPVELPAAVSLDSSLV